VAAELRSDAAFEVYCLVDSVRGVEILAEALAADPAARERFETLSYSAKQRFVLPIGQAKTEETRQRRVAKVITDLRAGR
jgi:uncharacterized protein YdeI (YjbR/CyaY-like superfamily)